MKIVEGEGRKNKSGTIFYGTIFANPAPFFGKNKSGTIFAIFAAPFLPNTVKISLFAVRLRIA